ncbi:MAG: glycosyltransferase [Bacilli bacterium]
MEKIIHYCWFGPKPLPKLAKKCIKSWEKYLPDYKIIKWSEDNVDLFENQFIKSAYENKKWAFVADYVRTKVLYEMGGIYLDTDMEIIKPINELLDTDFVIGVEDSGYIAAGIIISKEKKNKYLKKMLDLYKTMKIEENMDFFQISIPKILSRIFKDEYDIKNANFIQTNKDKSLKIYPREYFYPLSYDRQNNIFTNNTFAVHYYDASWVNNTEKIALWLKRHKLDFVTKYVYSISRRLKKFKKTV